MNLCGNANRFPQAGQLRTFISSVIARMLIARFIPLQCLPNGLLNIGAVSHSEFPNRLIQTNVHYPAKFNVATADCSPLESTCLARSLSHQFIYCYSTVGPRVGRIRFSGSCSGHQGPDIGSAATQFGSPGGWLRVREASQRRSRSAHSSCSLFSIRARTDQGGLGKARRQLSRTASRPNRSWTFLGDRI